MTPILTARRLVVTTVVIACTSTLVAEATAQPYYVDGRAYGTVEAGGLRVQFDVIQMPWVSSVWYVTPAGIEVYRRAVGTLCGAGELITEAPVPWTWDGGANPPMSFEVLDETAQPGAAYVYLGRAVDASGDAIPENPDAAFGAATHGIALIAHGQLYAGPGGCGESYVQQTFGCGDCYMGGRFTAEPAVLAHVNTGKPFLLYGVVSGYNGTCGASEVVMHFSSAIPTNCVVSVQETSWGYIKSLYR